MVYYKAKLLRKKYRINAHSGVDFLKMIIHKQGYNLIPYCESILTLTALGLDKEARTASALSVIDSNGDITVYYNSLLPSKKQRKALAHELGHIELNHKHKKISNEQQEKEADQFARYLLEDSGTHHLIFALIIFISMLIFLCITLLYISDSDIFASSSVTTAVSECDYSFAKNTEERLETTSKPISSASCNNEAFFTESQTTNITQSVVQSSAESVYASQPCEEVIDNSVCYFTENGDVYHLYPDCHYIRNSNNVLCDTIIDSNKERLCSACERRNNNQYY